MKRMCGVGAAALTVAGVLALGGCSGVEDGDAAGKPSPRPSASAMSVDDALDAYQRTTASGCTDAADCQEFMTRKLAAAKDLRQAMAAEDRERFAEPIGDLDEAQDRADHYGRDNLGAKGNSFAVSQPIQEAVAWLRVHG